MLGDVKSLEPYGIRAFSMRHAVLVFYVLVFALSFGLSLILVGPGAFLGTTTFGRTDAELASAGDLDPLMIVAILTFLGAPLVALLVIALGFGRAGLRDLRSRLFRWRVGIRWYAVALLTAPLLWTAILFALSLTSDAFLTGIITAEDRASLLVAGLVLGLVGAFEELAWPGLATNELSKRHGLLATGLLVGLLWCLLHWPLFAAFDSGAVPRALAVSAIFFFMVPYRVLMVWVYRHTQSVLLAMLMHLALNVWQFVLPGPAMAGVPVLIFNLAFGATLWVFVAAVVAANRRKLSRGEHARATPLNAG
jgi:membrane protease YdiL (CAAX protease family)